MTPFHEKQDKILQWLRAKGYTGTPQDAMYKYVKDNSSIAQGTFYDHLNSALWAAGYTGAILDDRLTSMFISKTGVTNRKDAERKFFADSSLNMFSSFVPGSINLHLDTDLSDSTSNDVTVTAVNGAAVSASQPKFGAGSLSLTRASSQYVTFPDSANFQMGSGDFQIDWWAYITDVSLNQYFLSDADAAGTTFSISCNVGGGGPGVVICQVNSGAGIIIHQTTMSNTTQTHIMIKCVSGVITLYVGGVASNTTITGETITSNQAGGIWVIGRTGLNNGNYVGGFIDEFHWFKGVSALPSPNPPTAAYS